MIIRVDEVLGFEKRPYYSQASLQLRILPKAPDPHAWVLGYRHVLYNARLIFLFDGAKDQI